MSRWKAYRCLVMIAFSSCSWLLINCHVCFAYAAWSTVVDGRWRHWLHLASACPTSLWVLFIFFYIVLTFQSSFSCQFLLFFVRGGRAIITSHHLQSFQNTSRCMLANWCVSTVDQQAVDRCKVWMIGLLVSMLCSSSNQPDVKMSLVKCRQLFPVSVCFLFPHCCCILLTCWCRL